MPDLPPPSNTRRTLWRIFYTQPRAEKKCEEHLSRQGVDVFLPKRIVIRQWSDRKKAVTEPLFPNYIFARVDEAERLRVLQAPQIVRCLFFGGEIAEVTEEEIAQLKITQNDPRRLASLEQDRLPIGRQVTLTAGPLSGLRGEVIEHRGEHYVLVRIEAMKQAVKVQVAASWVYPDTLSQPS